MSVILECRNLTKQYGSVSALNHMNLKLETGKIIGLLGPNGSGKTTLIKLANGLLTPSTGEILIDETSVGRESKKQVAYLPERTYLNKWTKVKKLIDFFEDMYENFEADMAYEMLERLNINPEHSLKTMSKGMCEKVQLILVMSRKAKLYLLDEPIGGVDPAARDYILDTIINHYNKEGTILISTHLVADVEKVLDEVIFLKEGSVVRHTSVEDLRMQEEKSLDAIFREEFRC